YTKTPITAVVSSTSTSITYTGVVTAGSCVITGVGGTVLPWIGENVSGPDLPTGSTISSIGAGQFTINQYNENSCPSTSNPSESITGDGMIVTLTTSAASIPYGSDFWYSGYPDANSFLLSSNANPSLKPDIVTCGIQGSGLYSTATGGTACSGDNITLMQATTVPNGTTIYLTPPYFEKIIVTASGTSTSPIVIEGIPNPTTGELPALDPAFATTGPNMAHTGSTSQFDAYATSLLFAWNSAYTSYPEYVTFENIRLQDAKRGLTQYDGTNTAYTTAVGWSTRLDDLSYGTLHGVQAIYCQLGIFGADNPGLSYPNILDHLTMDSNYFYQDGEGSGEHSSYIESRGVTYQYSWYDTTTGGSELKDRSSGTVIRYNRFALSASGEANDLVASQNGAFDIIPMDVLTVPLAGFAAGTTSLTFTPITVTGSTTAGSNIVTVSSIAGMNQGAALIGTGIPSPSQIGGFAQNTPHLNYPATATTTNESMTTNTVQGINVGDRVGYYTGNMAWGYPGNTMVMPVVTAVDTTTDSITISPGLPMAVGQWTANYAYPQYAVLNIDVGGTAYYFFSSAGGTSGATAPTWCSTANCTVTDGTVTWTNEYAAPAVLTVISQTLNPYKQTFVYGNEYEYLQTNQIYNIPAPVHYGHDSGSNTVSDPVADRAGTLYFYDNTFVTEMNQSLSYYFGLLRTESDSDAVDARNNFWYVTNHTTGSAPTYFELFWPPGYSGNNNVQTAYTSGNNQVGTSSSVGANTTCGVAWTGAQACGGSGLIDPSGSFAVGGTVTESPTNLYPSGLTGYPYKLQAGSTAIGAGSTLAAAVTSNTLGGNFTPVYQPDGTARTNLLDLGAWQYSSTPFNPGHWWGGGKVGFIAGAIMR
ncbi:MAG: hypothetical protein ACYCOU_24970, partial [Sulfobacillus sp.]